MVEMEVKAKTKVEVEVFELPNTTFQFFHICSTSFFALGKLM